MTAAEALYPKSTEDLEFVKCLGKGFFGEVWQARQKKDGTVFAVKKVQLQLIVQNRLTEQLQREVNILKALDHPRIIRLFFDFKDGSSMYLGMDFASGGSLFDKLSAARRFVPEVAARYFYETCEALDYIHHLPEKVIHRDIKPENILLTTDDHVKLADFGWANMLQAADKRETFCGTLDYLPPEMIMGTGHDESADMWNMGVLLYELTTGQSPFGSTSKDRPQQQEITCRLILSVDLRFPAELDSDARDLIVNLCKKKPSERLVVRSAMSHRFISKCLGAAAGTNGSVEEADAGRPSVAARALRKEHEKISAEMQQLLKAKMATEESLKSITEEVEEARAQVQAEQQRRAKVEASCAALSTKVAARDHEIEELRKKLDSIKADGGEGSRSPTKKSSLFGKWTSSGYPGN
mmetsp:Transcript_137671/g.243249  ORF Transcript_137671/g.243249 Transcript_137671/m.243249 type:complete len:410 (+) Transcript_137671:18-1247(+)